MNSNDVKLLPGKLPQGLLDRLLKKYTGTDKQVVVGAQTGEDAAVIDAGDHYLVIKTDPITFVTDEIGHYVVHVNANDIVCMGGRPRWFLVTVLLPEGATVDSTTRIFKQISAVCRRERICYCGGHTEVTVGLDRPVVTGVMIGEVAKDRLLLKSNIQSDDHILLIKEIPIEATSIIAREKAEELAKVFSRDFVRRCQDLLFHPGISVRQGAVISLQSGIVHAFHDPTEGGVATALYELAMACHLGFSVFFNQIPLVPEGRLLCDHYDLNPLGCISSGSLLALVPGKSVSPMLARFHREGIVAADIGVMVNDEKEKILVVEDEEMIMPVFHQDEVIKVLSGKNNGIAYDS